MIYAVCAEFAPYKISPQPRERNPQMYCMQYSRRKSISTFPMPPSAVSLVVISRCQDCRGKGVAHVPSRDTRSTRTKGRASSRPSAPARPPARAFGPFVAFSVCGLFVRSFNGGNSWSLCRDRRRRRCVIWIFRSFPLLCTAEAKDEAAADAVDLE